MEHLDLDKHHIGLRSRVEFQPRHLARMNKMVITIGEERSLITVFSGEKNQGRLKIKSRQVRNKELLRVAKHLAGAYRVERQNIEVLKTNEEQNIKS